MDNYSNEKLKEEILKANYGQLETIAKSSLLNILISINSAEELLDKNEILKREENKEYREIVAGFVVSLRESLETNDMDGILSLREEILSKKNILDAYLIEISYLGQIVDEHGTKLLAERPEYRGYRSKNVSEMIHMIEHLLDDNKDNYGKYIFIISELVKVLPMRLVKKNYYDILRKTITRNFKNYNRTVVDMLIDSYKKQFDGSLRDGYGIEFDKYFFEIESIKRRDLENMSLEELSEVVKEIMATTEELVLFRDLILTLGIGSNLLIVVNKLSDILEDREEILRDWASQDDSLKYRDNLKGKVLSLDQALSKDLKAYEELTIEVSRREDFPHEEMEEELMATREVLAFYNDVNFSDIKYLEDLDLDFADGEYIKNAVDILIEYIDLAMVGMKNTERKIRMRTLLASIELPFENIGEFTDYIAYALDSRILSNEIINFKVEQINYFLNEIHGK